MGIYNNVKQSITRHIVLLSQDLFIEDHSAGMPSSPGEPGDLHYDSSTDTIYEYTTGWVAVNRNKFFFDFDGHADVQEFPKHDLVGMQAFGFSMEGDLLTAEVNVGVGLFDDYQLYKHDKAMDVLVGKFLPKTQIPYIDMTTGMAKSAPLVVFDDVDVYPVGKANNRPFQFVRVRLSVSDAYSLT